jgi:two-component system, cell cycle response regulator
MTITQSAILAASILIVDDQASNVALLDQLLAASGYTHVTSTQNPHEVCALHQKNHFDLILLDLHMPGMDGFQVMKRLSAVEIDGYAPILAITAQPGLKLRALASGAKDFIAKPYDLIEIKTRIHNLLEFRLLYQRLKASNRELEFFALQDALTGLPNRRLLIDRLKHAMQKSARTGNHCALMFLDLDHFKTLNDTLGHDAGDQLLKSVSARLLACVRDGDTVARWGGDEFVLLLEGLSHSILEAQGQANFVAQKILGSFAEPFPLGDYSYTSSTSVGVEVFSGDNEPLETLLKNADLAMYDAKKSSRIAVEFSEPTTQT